MSFIKEPEGVDFVIAPSPYTDEDRDAISAYLREYKAKAKAKSKTGKKRTPNIKQV